MTQLNLEELENIILNEGVLRELAELNHAYARQDCPVKRGDVQHSIRYAVFPDEKKIIVGSDHPVTKYLEWGTGPMERAHGVHDPKNPVKDWEAKRKTGKNQLAQMPFLRPAAFRTQKFAGRIIPKKIVANVKLVMR